MQLNSESGIFNATLLCSDLFETMYQHLSHPSSTRSDSGGQTKISAEDIADAFGRFKIWAGNIGALKVGKASLDSRLGHADIRLEVLRLLKQMFQSQTECKNCLRLGL